MQLPRIEPVKPVGYCETLWFSGNTELFHVNNLNWILGLYNFFSSIWNALC